MTLLAFKTRAVPRTPDVVLGRYQPIALLGEGSVARVYLVLSRGPIGAGDPLVIKEIRPELASQVQFREMFLNEARVALGLHHPNIVRTYEIFEERSPYVVAMEFLDGQSLANLLRRVGRAKVSLASHIWLLTQVLAGLQHAHGLCDAEGEPLGIVHRDVSPLNVFLTYDGKVKLVDFGIAKFTGMIADKEGKAVSGKLGYGAPEQFVSQPIDPRSDVYSVGVMLWEALARKRRRVSDNPSEIVDARIAGREPRISDVVPGVPHLLAEICDRATAPDVRTRYQSALEMQQDLEFYLDGCRKTVDGRQVGELLARAFSAERTSMRRCIERHLSAFRPGVARPGKQSRPSSLRLFLARCWHEARSAALSAAPPARLYEPAALLLVAVIAVIAVARVTTSSPQRALRAARVPGSHPAPAVAIRPPLPAAPRQRPAPLVTPLPTSPAQAELQPRMPDRTAVRVVPRLRASLVEPTRPDRRPIIRPVRPIFRPRRIQPASAHALPETRRADARPDPGRRLRLSRRTLDEGDPYAP
jgi:serine/threonine protein kinase